MDFTFFGKKLPRLNGPASGHVGDSLEREIAKELPGAVASQRALQAARAEAAKRQREEDRAVARMLGSSNEN